LEGSKQLKEKAQNQLQKARQQLDESGVSGKMAEAKDSFKKKLADAQVKERFTEAKGKLFQRSQELQASWGGWFGISTPSHNDEAAAQADQQAHADLQAELQRQTSQRQERLPTPDLDALDRFEDDDRPDLDSFFADESLEWAQGNSAQEAAQLRVEEENVEALAAMGFARDHIQAALRIANQNVEHAAVLLVENDPRITSAIHADLSVGQAAADALSVAEIPIAELTIEPEPEQHLDDDLMGFFEPDGAESNDTPTLSQLFDEEPSTGRETGMTRGMGEQKSVDADPPSGSDLLDFGPLQSADTAEVLSELDRVLDETRSVDADPENSLDLLDFGPMQGARTTEALSELDPGLGEIDDDFFK